MDEAQASIGVARAHSPAGGELNGLLVSLERDLWVLMADLATGGVEPPQADRRSRPS